MTPLPIVPDAIAPLSPLVKNLKPKATLSLQGLLKPTPIAVALENPAESVEAVVQEPVTPERLRVVWDEFAEKRKDQMAEYHILNRDYEYEHPVIVVTLTNPVEEGLLENFRSELIQFLRDRLKNSALNVTARHKEATGKKVIYTSKEKFEHLAEKNPYLNELKERLGLDWDF